jgi:hypothetical protein
VLVRGGNVSWRVARSHAVPNIARLAKITAPNRSRRAGTSQVRRLAVWSCGISLKFEAQLGDDETSSGLKPGRKPDAMASH